MFAVKEFDNDGSFIGHTSFQNNYEAIKLAKRIKKYQPYLNVCVTEIDYNNEGEIWELIVWRDQ